MSSPIPEDSNEYVVLQPATPAVQSDYPRYEYPDRQPVVPPGMPHYDYIGLQKENYPSYTDQYKPPNEYLQLEDCNYANEDYNYYEDITYERPEQKSSKMIRILIIVVTLLVIFIAILIGILSWNFYWGKNKGLAGEPQFCADTAHTHTCRQSFVRNMTISAFNAYRSYAWGAPEFKPIALEAFNNMYGHGRNMGTFPGLTIVDAMDTLWIMSMMDEWEEGKQWIVTNLHVADLDQMLRVKEILLGYLCGLLSAYALSGDQDLLHKSIEVMEALKPAFNKDTGLLAYRYNPKVKFSTAKVDNTVQRVRLRVVNGKVVNTTEPASVDQVATVTSAPVPIVERDNANSIGLVGFQQPELIYFANLTGDSLIEEQLVKSRAVMSSIDRPKGLWMSYLNAATGKSNFTGTGLFDETTDFFYNMIRSYVQLNRQDAQLLKMYTDAIDNIQKMQLLKNIGNQLFARKFDTKALLHTNNMDDTSCLLGGMLALGARELQKANSPKFHLHWQLAVNITDTCYQAANRTKTKLLPHSFTLNNAISTEGWMAPNLAETYFILFRLTGDNKYREWAWEMAQALYRHSRTISGGFAGVFNVDKVPTDKYDYQNTVFLTGTLKYLYLTFSNTSILSLDDWIFNPRGHPLPICGTNEHYPVEKCTF